MLSKSTKKQSSLTFPTEGLEELLATARASGGDVVI